MEQYMGTFPKWTRGLFPSQLVYEGKIVCTRAENKEQAEKNFQKFIEKNKLSVLEKVSAIPLELRLSEGEYMLI